MIMNDIIDLIRTSGSIVILPHVSADGDALGSSLALGLAVEKFNKQAAIFLEEPIPVIYSFLPGQHIVKVCSRHGEAAVSGSTGLPCCKTGKSGEAHELVIALDTGDLERLGERADIFNKAIKTVNIDHHATNSMFADYNLVQTHSSAVGEIIYQLLKMMGIDMDTDIANCLYVAITTDTGGFRFSNTTPLTHQITADLVSAGVNVADISQKVFDIVSLQKVKLMGMAVETLELYEDGRIAFISITEQMMKDTGAGEEDCEGIVNMGRNIRGVEAALLFRQRDDEIRVNLRSNSEKIDVAAIANLHSGGGHKKAAGCTVKGTLSEAKRMLLDDIRRALL